MVLPFPDFYTFPQAHRSIEIKDPAGFISETQSTIQVHEWLRARSTALFFLFHLLAMEKRDMDMNLVVILLLLTFILGLLTGIALTRPIIYR